MIRRSWKRLWDFIKIWFSYRKVLWEVYDFDYSGILRVERYQLERTIKSIEKYQNHVNAWHDLLWMKRALYCLDVMLEEVEVIELVMDSMKWKPVKYVNIKNYKRFMPRLPDPLVLGKDSLYQQKAWYLYHEIRKTYMRSWWD